MGVNQILTQHEHIHCFEVLYEISSRSQLSFTHILRFCGQTWWLTYLKCHPWPVPQPKSRIPGEQTHAIGLTANHFFIILGDYKSETKICHILQKCLAFASCEVHAQNQSNSIKAISHFRSQRPYVKRNTQEGDIPRGYNPKGRYPHG